MAASGDDRMGVIELEAVHLRHAKIRDEEIGLDLRDRRRASVADEAVRTSAPAASKTTRRSPIVSSSSSIRQDAHAPESLHDSRASRAGIAPSAFARFQTTSTISPCARTGQGWRFLYARETRASTVS